MMHSDVKYLDPSMLQTFLAVLQTENHICKRSVVVLVWRWQQVIQFGSRATAE